MKRSIIGITGGVGSGKSTVLQILKEEYQAEIIEADAVARELMEPGGSVYQAVVNTFGPPILQDMPAAGEAPIDRNALAKIVFADRSRREMLNALTHPAVKDEVIRRIAASRASLIVYESAIPYEARMKELCDEIWYVYAPQEVRIGRLTASRGYTREKCLAMMASQMSDDEFRRISNRVIDNGGTEEMTAGQIREMLGDHSSM